MKIGFDAKRAFLNQSGLGNYSRNILIALKNYFPENQYTLFTPEIKEEIFPEQSDFDVVSPESSALKLFKSVWRSFSLSRRLDKHELDLFHGLSHELPAGIQKTNVPSIVTIHDLIFLRYPEYYKSIDRKIYFQKVKLASENAHKIIAISNQTKMDIMRYLKVDASKIEIIHQCIAPVYFEPVDKNIEEQIVKKFNLPQEFILSVGTIEARKNQLNILKALKLKGIKTHLVLIGKLTSYAAVLSDFIEKNGMDGQVTILNNVLDVELPYFYIKARMSLYISLFEGFGLPVIESMAMGCPAIVSNTSCLPETGGDAAIYCGPENVVEIGDSISRVLEDQKMYEDHVKKGLKHALYFTPEKSAKALIEVYQKVLENE